MAAITPNSPPISPDGRFWWDGQAWQPLYSPDGMWRWSGQAWVPLAEPFGAEAGSLGSPAMTQPTPSYAAAAPAAGPEAPPAWLDPSAAAILAPPVPALDPMPAAYAPPARMSMRPFIYLGGALLVGAIVLTGWIFRDQLRAQPLDSASTLPSPSPSPSGSEFDRAQGFLNGILGPSIDQVNQTLPGLQAACAPDLPVACRDAILATDQKVLATSKAIASADIPPCIATPMAQFNRDWSGIESGLEMSLSGYQYNSKQLIITGLQRVVEYAGYLKADAAGVSAAQPACTH
ncbi:MAG TPA: hypothetical protein VLU92_05645 [Candidatus Dormibacteraeota bacterium]|nr:hypothetical protein [Candidatus Dormibacteraeota bacterium]